MEGKLAEKLAQIERRYADLCFHSVGEVEVEYCKTREHFTRVPESDAPVRWKRAIPGLQWGGPGITAWFKGVAKLPSDCRG